MITRINDSQQSIEYTDAHGNVIKVSPFQSELYTALTARITDQLSANGDNTRNRKNYEDAVRNLQISIDAGRTTLADSEKKLPVAPVYRSFPDDPALPEDDGDWTPPLLTLHDLTNVVPSHPFVAVTSDHIDVLQTIIDVAKSPVLADLLDLLKGLLHPQK